MRTATTRVSQTREEWLAERKTYIGGSDAASVLNTAEKVIPEIRYGCARKLVYDKTDVPKDFDDGEKMEFRRGRRLEHVAAAFYEEKTGREIRTTTTLKVPGKPHLATNMDRLVFKKEDKERKNPGYLELKVLGRFTFLKVKKEGLISDYLIQMQQGCAVSGCDWGSYGIYSPDFDELLHWDVEADKDFGELILEKSDDFFNFHVVCGVIPEPLPESSAPCSGCPWSITCRGSIQAPASVGVVSRPDLESLVAKIMEVKGINSESDDAYESLKVEFMDAVRGAPGVYSCGKYQVPFTITKTKRFNGELLKKKDPALYESLRVESETKKIMPKEI